MIKIINTIKMLLLSVKAFVKKYACFIIIIIVLGIVLFSLWQNIKYPIRLDQHATTIASSVIGVVSTMFGLTAASYVFIWSELRSEGNNNIRLEMILNVYKQLLWTWFFNALVLTITLIIFNLIILGAMQTITSTVLFVEQNGILQDKSAVYNTYYNEENFLITWLIAADLSLTIVDIFLWLY